MELSEVIPLPDQTCFHRNNSNMLLMTLLVPTHIINSLVKTQSFPQAWKVARIFPIPKVNHPVANADMHPIFILPVLSKVYEKLIHHQVVNYIDSREILKENISGYRKGHSTTTVLLGIWDDIWRAMKRGQLTLMILESFLKAFDTIRYKTVLGFSNEYLTWTISYLTGGRHCANRRQEIEHGWSQFWRAAGLHDGAPSL